MEIVAPGEKLTFIDDGFGEASRTVAVVINTVIDSRDMPAYDVAWKSLGSRHRALCSVVEFTPESIAAAKKWHITKSSFGRNRDAAAHEVPYSLPAA